MRREKIALDRSEKVLKNKARSLDFFFPHWHGKPSEESKQSNYVIRLKKTVQATVKRPDYRLRMKAGK